MSISRLSALLCLLSGSALLSACTTAATADTPPTPQVVVANAPANLPPEAKPAAKVATAKPPAQRTTQARPTARPAPQARKPAAQKPTPQAAIQRIKQDPTSQRYKTGQKLTPQEVEDIIRQLSVCRPS